MEQIETTPQALAEILEGGRRTEEALRQTNPFLNQIADLLFGEIGPVEADVGAKAPSKSLKIQFIDRAYFYLVPETKHPHFPYLVSIAI
jgi:hypothetical protein